MKKQSFFAVRAVNSFIYFFDKLKARYLIGLFTLCGLSFGHAADLGLGTLTVDRPGVDIVGFELKLNGPTGSLSYSSKATLEYKVVGSNAWKFGPDLMRVRPDLGTNVSRDEAFAGALWNLNPNTNYDIRITVSNGVDTEHVITQIKTRALPLEVKDQPANVIIDAINSPTTSQIETIINAANPGDIIEFRGQHAVQNIDIRSNGTIAQPIYIRGADSASVGPGGVPGDSGDIVFTIHGDHLVMEGLHINGNMNTYQIEIRGTSSNPLTGFTFRRNTLTGRRGIKFYPNSDAENYDVTMYDNIFTGKWTWDQLMILASGGSVPGCGYDSLRCTWDDTGVVVNGQGHSIFNNTFSGFGDTIKTDRRTSVRNSSISYSKNKVLFGGDDGMELDDAFRNVVMHSNLIMNTYTGGSKQPNDVTGGPNYFVRNIFANQIRRPFKLNDGPNGVKIIHNTIVQINKYTWLQHNNGQIENIQTLNNIFVNLGEADQHLRFDSKLENEEWDGNAYYPDAEFELNYFKRRTSFSLAQNDAEMPNGYLGEGFENSGVLMPAQPFQNGTSMFGSDYKTKVSDFDARLNSGSPAITGAIRLNGYNSLSRGAIEYGEALPNYGARLSIQQDDIKPRAPSELSVM